MTNSHNSLDGTAPQSVINTTVSTLFNSTEAQKKLHVRDLLTATVSCQTNVVEEMLKKDPSLALEELEEKDFVTAPTNHRFNLKPYQAALALRDFKMAKIIKSYLDPAEAHKQFNEQKENEIVTVNEKPIFEQLGKLANAIYYMNKNDIILSRNAPTTVKKDSPVEQELYKFWRMLDATLDVIITIGNKPFIPDRLLLKALQLYMNHYGDWGTQKIEYLSDPRTRLFVEKIMGYDGIQRIMPVHYIQIFTTNYTSPHGFVREREKFLQHHSTRFGIDCADEIDFYPLRTRSSKDFYFIHRGGSFSSLSRGETYLAQELLSEFIAFNANEMARHLPRNREPSCSIS